MTTTIVPTLAQRVRMEELQRTFPRLLWMDILDLALGRMEDMEQYIKDTCERLKEVANAVTIELDQDETERLVHALQSYEKLKIEDILMMGVRQLEEWDNMAESMEDK